MSVDPTVYTIPPSVSFLDSLASGILSQCNSDQFYLNNVQIFLPNRRACRSLADAFLRQNKGNALLTPRMTPIGEFDEELLFSEEGLFLADSQIFPPAVNDLERRLVLTRLILETECKRLGEMPSPAIGAGLAQALITLLDHVQTEQLSFDNLSGLVGGDYAAHWQITLDFLKVVTDNWPNVLKVLGCVDPANRRNLVLESQVNYWKKTPPSGPVFVAGSTGSIPATAALLKFVSTLPGGAVILPGFDTTLTEEQIKILSPTHPQNGMCRLLSFLGVGPSDVRLWVGSSRSMCPDARVKLIRAASRPVGAKFSFVKENLKKALSNVQILACAGPQEEAGVIALALRQSLEKPNRTAALITPDRMLARRVVSELRRWNIQIDDSAGRPLSSTPVGVFLNLSGKCVLQKAAPVPLLSLLKHPLAAGGLKKSKFRSFVRSFEKMVLRGPRTEPGFLGLSKYLKYLSKKNKKSAEEIGPLIDWFVNIQKSAVEFESLLTSSAFCGLSELVEAHVAFVEVLASTERTSGCDRLWSGEEGSVAATFLGDLQKSSSNFPLIRGNDYPNLLQALMSEKTVRQQFGMHPRLHIWGLLEARLQHADFMCLGGLNEGVWPSHPKPDPWMSRSMRIAFGLAPVERRVGLSAHDFSQAFCAERVLITRAERVEGTPTIPSRWISQLNSVITIWGGKKRNFLDEFGDSPDWLGWQSILDSPKEVRPNDPPKPKPPIESRPRKLSVTQVETWMRDPYAIYSRHILRLLPLDPIDADPGAAERGNIVHQALDKFVSQNPKKLPADIIANLLEVGEQAFANDIGLPHVWAFWWPRYLKVVSWFAETERLYRKAVKIARTELDGSLVLDAPFGPFTLTAKADRVNEMKDGTISIIDYKTGSIPSKKDILLGFSPQLPLEAGIASAGGFQEVPANLVSQLEIWRLTGGDPPGKRHNVGSEVSELASSALKGFSALVALYDNPETPYLSKPNPTYAPFWSDYDHLARVQEWSNKIRPEE